MAAIESTQLNDTLKMSTLDQSKASMIHISVLPCATGPLTMPESITEVLDWQVEFDSQVTQRLPLYTILLDYNIIHSRYTLTPPQPPSPPQPEA